MARCQSLKMRTLRSTPRISHGTSSDLARHQGISELHDGKTAVAIYKLIIIIAVSRHGLSFFRDALFQRRSTLDRVQWTALERLIILRPLTRYATALMTITLETYA